MPDPELQHLSDICAATKQPEDIFGLLTGDAEKQLDEAHSLYRKFARVAHTDRYSAVEDQQIAHQAFIKLSDLWAECQALIKEGQYGKPRKAPPLATLASKNHTYEVTELLETGTISTLYRGVRDDNKEVLMRIGGNPSVSDLMRAEAVSLQKLNTAWIDGGSKPGSRGALIPLLYESFAVKPNNQVVNVMEWRDGHYSLVEVMNKFPDGIEPRHFVWIFKRLLAALSLTNDLGIVHGNVTPSNVFVHPATHGLQLIDWCWSIVAGTKVSGAQYPEAGGTATTALDLRMAASVMRLLLGNQDIPALFNGILKACQIDTPAYRPSDPWKVYESMDEAAKVMYGRPRFINLSMEGK